MNGQKTLYLGALNSAQRVLGASEGVLTFDFCYMGINHFVIMYSLANLEICQRVKGPI